MKYDFLKTPETNFCSICKGKHYHSDNATRQQQVRSAMQDKKYPSIELPNNCAGNTKGCLCEYAG